MSKRNVVVAGVLISAGLVVGVGVGNTFANRPHYQTSSKTISACRSDNDEALRIVRADSGCKRWEQKVKWDGSQTAVVRVEEVALSGEFPYEFNPERSRNVMRVDKIYADGVLFSGDYFCVELPFTPLFAADKDTGHIVANLTPGENLEGLCGQGTSYEAAIRGNTAGSWFFSE